MKLYQYYTSFFQEYGSLLSLRHPYYKDIKLKLQQDQPCFFKDVCDSTDTYTAMSSRKGNEQFHVCEKCLNAFFFSCNQGDCVDLRDYYKYANGHDLDVEVGDVFKEK